MKLPFDKFVLATGKLAEANKILEYKAVILIEDFKTPKHVIMGKHWLNGLMPEAFWFGSWGIQTTIEVIEGDTLEVTGE